MLHFTLSKDINCNLCNSLRVAILVNFKHFHNYDPITHDWIRDERATRHCSEKDGPALEKCFRKIGFEIHKGETLNDIKTRKEFIEELKEFSEDPENKIKHGDIVILVVMSHGDYGIIDRNGEEVFSTGYLETSRMRNWILKRHHCFL